MYIRVNLFVCLFVIHLLLFLCGQDEDAELIRNVSCGQVEDAKNGNEDEKQMTQKV
jgi:hypothetical protein